MTARLLVLDGGTATERAPEDLSELRDHGCWLDIQDPVAGDLMLVLSVITSFFGMNFDQLPYRSNEAFGAMLASFAVSAIVLVAYFRRRGWL